MKRQAPAGQNGTPSQRRARLDSHMRALNTQFSSWLQRQLAECPQEAWAPEVQQYMTYVTVIQEDFSDVLESETRAEVQASTALPPAAPAAAAPSPWLPSVAPAQAPAPSPFLLPSAGAGAGAPEPGFRFLFTPPAANAVQPVAMSPFAVAPNAAAQQATGEEDGDDEPQRPPSPSVVRGKGEEDGEECAFDGKAKMLVLANKEWANHGVGNLQLRRPQSAPTGSGGARLVMYNQAGKLVLNAKLYAGMKVRHVDDKSVALLLVNGAQAGENAAKPVQTMLRVKDGATAKQLARAVTENSPVS